MQGFAVKREIRPLSFSISVDKQPDGGVLLTVVHPLDGEAFVYGLDPDTADQVKAGFSGGIVTAPAGSVPPVPPA